MTIHRNSSLLGISLSFSVLALLFLMLPSNVATGITDAYKADFKLYTAKDEIKVASYNLLNLFDARHDSGKNDYTFLPFGSPGKTTYCYGLSNPGYRKLCLETDWSNYKFELKLAQLKKALASQGPLPDLLAVQEIENEYTARRLAETLGYERYLITNSPDKRGIDVALLYRTQKLKYIEHEAIRLYGSALKDKLTRDILRVHFQFRNGDNRNTLGVYMNHWPSQAAGPQTRVAAAKVLRSAINKQTSRIGKSRYYVIALGDFNTTAKDAPNAINDVMLDRYWSNGLFDAQTHFNSTGSSIQWKMPRGTYYYRGKNAWQKLDHILLSKNFRNNWGPEIIDDSFRIVAPYFMCTNYEYSDSNSDLDSTTIYDIPKRYDFTTTKVYELGYSDHFPVVVKLRID